MALNLVCCICWKNYGTRPGRNTGDSHGYCPECEPKVLADIMEWQRKRDRNEKIEAEVKQIEVPADDISK